MAKTLFYEFFPVLKKYPVWGRDDPLQPFYQWDLLRMGNEIPRLAEMGVDVIWLAGALQSPGHDHGYDVSDSYMLNPTVGTTYDGILDFVRQAHKHKMKVIIDLILNHTSIHHTLFRKHPEHYWWSDKPLNGWNNLYNDTSAWEFSKRYEKYYLHLFHPQEADLKWYDDDGVINETLVQEFQRIVEFWTYKVNIDGFHVDTPQCINKKLRDKLSFNDMLYDNAMAIGVISRVFEKKKNLILLSECFDQDGAITKKYMENTDIGYMMNLGISEYPADTIERVAKEYAKKREGFVLNLESHDLMRFLSRPGFDLDKELDVLFWTGADSVCLYQGQELGLKNPNLTMGQIICLDAQSAMRALVGYKVDRHTCRANARTPIPVSQIEHQRENAASPLRRFETEIKLWKSKDS